jgi:dTDP-4-dehydrorhamnose 3,5-epimerase
MILVNKVHNDIKVFTRENFKDNRGEFIKLYSAQESSQYLGDVTFNQVNIVHNNKRFVFRGLHYQKQPSYEGKLVRVLNGRVLDIILCVDSSSEYYGQFYEIELSDTNNKILYVPPSYAHGYVTLSDDTIVSYIHTDDRQVDLESGVNIFSFPNSIRDNFAERLIISNKDKNLKSLGEVE